ncbi:MAG: winged helix-turn-helix transcriptional regulator [Clostridiales bacterium]|nr:winged helix-turn-helix transcriptional regulator [Clostridiales bacterium]
MSKCTATCHEKIKDLIKNDDEFINNVVEASKVFSLLGDESRMKILLALKEGELCVYHICEITGGGQSATSQHLRKLKDYNMVKCRREGNQILYSLVDDHVITVINQTLEHLKCQKN